MAKLSVKKIKKADIQEYLNTYSDFSFEIKVLNKLTSLGFECEHSGIYEDPVTKKSREFDIRARKMTSLDGNTTFRFCMAVECKNIRENFPLLIHCMPRVDSEAYQHLVWSQNFTSNGIGLSECGRRFRIDGNECVYKVGEPVGKSCDQIGRRENGNLIGGDGDIFEKISQSINSIYDILEINHYAAIHERNRDSIIISFQLPVLVVPKNRIWTVTYDNLGNIIKSPKIVPRVSYYISKAWEIGSHPQEKHLSYFLSHLEIVEIDSLIDLINEHNDNNRFSHENLRRYYMTSMKKQLG